MSETERISEAIKRITESNRVLSEDEWANYIKNLKKEDTSGIQITVDHVYQGYFPDDFFSDPISFIQRSSSILDVYHPFVRLLLLSNPSITNGPELKLVVKIVDMEKIYGWDKKGTFQKADPFTELKIFQAGKLAGYPSAEPIGNIVLPENNTYIIFYKYVVGYHIDSAYFNLHCAEQTTSRNAYLELRESVYNKLNFEASKIQILYARIGINKTINVKDLVFDLDENNHPINIIPIDWERSEVDHDKLEVNLDKAIKSKTADR